MASGGPGSRSVDLHTKLSVVSASTEALKIENFYNSGKLMKIDEHCVSSQASESPSTPSLVIGWDILARSSSPFLVHLMRIGSKSNRHHNATIRSPCSHCFSCSKTSKNHCPTHYPRSHAPDGTISTSLQSHIKYICQYHIVDEGQEIKHIQYIHPCTHRGCLGSDMFQTQIRYAQCRACRCLRSVLIPTYQRVDAEIEGNNICWSQQISEAGVFFRFASPLPFFRFRASNL